MSIQDNYMDNLSITNPTYLNKKLQEKNEKNVFRQIHENTSKHNPNLIQNTYIILLTIFAVKLLSSAMY